LCPSEGSLERGGMSWGRTDNLYRRGKGLDELVGATEGGEPTKKDRDVPAESDLKRDVLVRVRLLGVPREVFMVPTHDRVGGRKKG